MKNARDLPIRIQKEEATLRRLPKNHPKFNKLKNSIEKRKAGHRGELNVDYHLSFLPSKYTILNNLHLKNGEKEFEIDRLLLSPNLILDIETKNYGGILIFHKDSKQLIQIFNGIEKGYPNPIQQAERQLFNLSKWLEARKLPSSPMDYLVTISFPKTIIKSDDDTIFQKILHAEHIVNKILELAKTHKTPLFDEKTLRKFKKTFLKASSPPDIIILEIWDIDPSEILTGVICPYCQHLPMIRLHSRWYCPNCKLESKNAHIQAIEDYFLIFKDTITNKECREFLHIPSRRTVEYILRSMSLVAAGTTKGTTYSKSP